jgi:hypothetical protein
MEYAHKKLYIAIENQHWIWKIFKKEKFERRRRISSDGGERGNEGRPLLTTSIPDRQSETLYWENLGPRWRDGWEK